MNDKTIIYLINHRQEIEIQQRLRQHCTRMGSCLKFYVNDTLTTLFFSHLVDQFAYLYIFRAFLPVPHMAFTFMRETTLSLTVRSAGSSLNRSISATSIPVHIRESGIKDNVSFGKSMCAFHSMKNSSLIFKSPTSLAVKRGLMPSRDLLGLL